MQAVKPFVKEIGAPDAIIFDAAKERTSQNLRQFCHEIGTTLRVLGGGALCANEAELHIGRIKDAVRKDVKEPDSPGIIVLKKELESTSSQLKTCLFCWVRTHTSQ